MNASLKLALIGANGMLAQGIKAIVPASFDLIELDLPDFDITRQDQVMSMIKPLAPDVIINCAAYTHVDGCETHEALAFSVNGEGPGYLAQAALAVGAVLVHISTDYVFSGDKTEPYVEDDLTGPVSAYGRSKLMGEKSILSSGLLHYFILRTSWLYGMRGKNFVETILRLAAGEELRVVSDQQGSPTYTEDLANAIFVLLGSKSQPGVYHLSNTGSCSWYEFAVEIVQQARENQLPVKVDRVIPIRTADYPLPAKRPAYSVFSKQK